MPLFYSGVYISVLTGYPGSLHIRYKGMDPPILNRRSFTVTWVSRIVIVLPIVQLGQHILELLRDGQADMRSILQQGQALISFLMVNLLRQKRAEHGLARTTIA